MTMHPLVSVPFTYAKGGCYLCLKDTDCVDLGASIEGEGGLAMCDRCLEEAARTMGYSLKRKIEPKAKVT